MASRDSPRKASRLAILGWLLFAWASQPYFTLILTFIYAPYFASAVVGDATRGQSIWGFATAVAGVVIACISPVLGAIADATGRRKPWIAAFGAMLVAGAAALWVAKPGDAATIMPALIGFVFASIGAEFAHIFCNTMMPMLVPRKKLGSLSGLGWATGYVGGMISLILSLAFLATNPETGRTLLGLSPAFGLDAAAREGDRATGPLTAIWFVVFVTPLFLFTPDGKARYRLGPAIKHGLQALADTVRSARQHRDLWFFLIANMIYTDGLIALFAFGGIYGAGTFGWQTIQLGLFGILLTITGTIGAYVGGKLDDRLGAKTVVLGALVVLVISICAILSVSRDRIFFFLPVAPPVPGGGIFASDAERFYVVLGALIGMVAGPLQAASRTLLVRLAPHDRLAQFFGLFALSGKLTSFMGPFLVATVTAATASQKAGISVLIAFYVVGGVLLASARIRSS
ncbi:MAG TPA: MFS transporter [Xanthobacteraceae bacterium]|nr:MFS transporter [Xanthobacteraceae bacterium]